MKSDMGRKMVERRGKIEERNSKSECDPRQTRNGDARPGGSLSSGGWPKVAQASQPALPKSADWIVELSAYARRRVRRHRAYMMVAVDRCRKPARPFDKLRVPSLSRDRRFALRRRDGALAGACQESRSDVFGLVRPLYGLGNSSALTCIGLRAVKCPVIRSYSSACLISTSDQRGKRT